MSDTVLLLGPIVFQDFEVPERINFGGGQRLAVHQFPGGARIIDTLGREDADIVFNGTFTGDDATLRARTLDGLRAAGSVLALTWDVFTYSVVIRDFVARYERPGWIPFHLCCAVLRDEAAAAEAAPLSLAASMLGDLSVADTLTAGLGLAGVATALSAAAGAARAAGAGQRGSAACTAASASLDATRETLAAAIGAAQAGLAADAVTTATGIAGTLGTLEALAMLTTARAHAGRAAANLVNATT